MQQLQLSSDDGLRLAILEMIAADGRFASAAFHVGVSNGIAHLAGRVDSFEMRLLVEDSVSRVPGIRGVVNRIEAPGAPSPGRTVNLDLKAGKINQSDKEMNDEK